MSGYDAPIHDVGSDVLGRAAFAQGIARLVIDAPEDWGVRVGVYGRWGEGKSSVLNMIAHQLRSEGHLVAEFNPWGCNSSEEMFELLADTLVVAAKGLAYEVEGGVTRAAKKGGKVLAKAGGIVGGDVGKMLSPWLLRWAQNRKSDIARVVGALHDRKRLVVLVDDVDRVDPKLVPRLFFALHEVFALPLVSFVLALDPDVVGAALTDYHAGFKSGVEFLAKIVQFPRWLPPPSVDAVRQLAERDRSTFAKFLGAPVLAQEAKLLPVNPRDLRAFIRGLSCLAHEVERHDPDELDEHLLVVLEALRQASPVFLSTILEREDLLSMGPVEFSRDGSTSKAEAEIQELAQTICPENVVRITELGFALCRRSINWTATYIRYHAYLGERPNAVTWREFRALLECTSDEGRRSWVLKHADGRKVSISAVLRECLYSCIRLYRRDLEEAADASSLSGNRTKVLHAGLVLDSLEWIWFRCPDAEAERTPDAFLQLVQAFRSWAHFVLNADDRAQRDRESNLLVAVVKSLKSPIEVLEVLKPWETYHQRAPQAEVLTAALLAEIEGRACDELLLAFEKPSGISGCLFGARLSERYLLLNHEPMWTKERTQALENLAAEVNENVADNCRVFAEVLLNPGRNQISMSSSTLHSDHRLLKAIWTAASATPVQTRFFRKMQTIRDAIGELLGIQLEAPHWWERVRGLAEGTPESS